MSEKCMNCKKGEFKIKHNDGLKQCDKCKCLTGDYCYKVN